MRLTAGTGAGVAGMKMAVVSDLDECIRERGMQSGLQLADRGRRHSGALIWRLSQKPWAMTKMKVKPSVPKSLKSTQISSG